MDYFVHLEGRRRHIRIQPSGVEVDGVPFEVELAPRREGRDSDVRTVRGPDRSVRLLCREGGRGRWDLEMNGIQWTAEVLDRGQEAVRQARTSSARPAGPQPLRAPMPGLVVRVEVHPGDEVIAGQGVLIVEAMKMENELRAPVAARVRAVHVREGVAVEKDAVLVDFEPLDAREGQ